MNVPTGVARLEQRLLSHAIRVAIAAILACGVLTSIPSESWGVTGMAGDGNSGIAMYGKVLDNPPKVLDNPPRESPKQAPDTSTLGRDETGDGAGAVQELDSHGAQSLPFTGWSAMSVALAGLILLVAGVAGRRSRAARS